MEKIKELLEINPTLKLMLLTDLEYNKTGGLFQISLDTGLSEKFIYQNYHNILQIAKD